MFVTSIVCLFDQPNFRVDLAEILVLSGRYGLRLQSVNSASAEESELDFIMVRFTGDDQIDAEDFRKMVRSAVPTCRACWTGPSVID